jgi:hypothetical protein
MQLADFGNLLNEEATRLRNMYYQEARPLYAYHIRCEYLRCMALFEKVIQIMERSSPGQI